MHSIQSYLKIFLACIWISHLSAQNLSNVAYAPTLTSIDGQEVDIQSWLDDGKYVILDFFTTWCNPCWNLHKSGMLDSMYLKYGPGTDLDLVRVVSIEMSIRSSDYDLLHMTDVSIGNWQENIQYPIVNIQSAHQFELLRGAYLVGGYPSLRVLYPDGSWAEDGISVQRLEMFLESGTPLDEVDILASDPHVVSLIGNTFSCDSLVTLGVVFTNFGESPIGVSERLGLWDIDTIDIEFQSNTAELDTYWFTQNAHVIRSDFVSDGFDLNVNNHQKRNLHHFDSVQTIDGNIDPDFTFVEHTSKFENHNDDPFLIRTRYYYQDAPLIIGLGAFDFAPSDSTYFMSFDYSKGQDLHGDADKIAVVYSEDCGNSWQVLWEQSGTELQTHSMSCTDTVWRQVNLEIDACNGQDEILLGYQVISTGGCDILFKGDPSITLDQTSPSTEVSGSYTLDLHPNPSTQEICFSNGLNTSTLSILDSSGNLFTAQSQNGICYDISHLKSGVYYALIQSSRKHAMVRRFIKL